MSNKLIAFSSCLILGVFLILTPVRHVLACVPVSPTTCLSSCESQANQEVSTKTAKSTITTQSKTTKQSIETKIDNTDKSNTQAIMGASTAATQGMATFANVYTETNDASNRVELEMLRQEKMLEAQQNIRVNRAYVDCQNISKNVGVLQGLALQRAAAKNRTHESLDAFQHVAGIRDTQGNARSYSRGSVMSDLYKDWLTKYCSPTSNNGMSGEVEGCGSERDTNDPAMENMDIKISDIMFMPNTLPRKELLDAGRSITYYLGPKPMKPISVRNYSDFATQENVVKFRTVLARKALADSVFDDLAMKRAPTIPSAVAKELLSADIENNASLKQLVDNIGDRISYAQWSDIVTNKRYIGMDYSQRAAKLDGPEATKEIAALLAQRLVLQRERYLMLEKLLGILAADYSMDIEETSPAKTTVAVTGG